MSEPTRQTPAVSAPWPQDLPRMVGGGSDLARRQTHGVESIVRALGTAPRCEEDTYAGAKDAVAHILTALFGAFGAYSVQDGGYITNPHADTPDVWSFLETAKRSWEADREDYTVDPETSAAELARRAVSYLTAAEMSPSTSDLLMLGGIEADEDAFEEDEKTHAVREILARYGVTVSAVRSSQLCRDCGKPFPYDRDADTCPQCVAESVGAALVCPECGAAIWDGPKWSKLAKCWNSEGHASGGTLAFDTLTEDDADADPTLRGEIGEAYGAARRAFESIGRVYDVDTNADTDISEGFRAGCDDYHAVTFLCDVAGRGPDPYASPRQVMVTIEDVTTREEIRS